MYELTVLIFLCSFMFISPNMICHIIYFSMGTRQINVAYWAVKLYLWSFTCFEDLLQKCSSIAIAFEYLFSLFFFDLVHPDKPSIYLSIYLSKPQLKRWTNTNSNKYTVTIYIYIYICIYIILVCIISMLFLIIFLK